MATSLTLAEFYREDFPRTLFPLKMNLWLVEHGLGIIQDYIYQEITGEESDDSGDFQQQERVYAAKHGLHLRRTHKLDPIAEVFVYDIVHRHRAKFRKDIFPSRTNFGYRFEHGGLLPSSDSYRDFKMSIHDNHQKFRFSCSFDVSSYFNSIYHHDLSSWFEGLAEQEADAKIFGKFFRQINGGRSVDCLPHGLYPTKMIGGHFLKFIDNFPGIESEIYLRFMDDFVLFSDDLNKLQRDFILIQQQLGHKGLSVNPAKTKFSGSEGLSVEDRLDTVRAGLLRKRAAAFRSLYWDEAEEQDGQEEDEESLTVAERDYLLRLLDSSQLEEDDADLVLAYLRDESDNLLDHLSGILWRFPYLSKSVYLFSRFIEDKSGLLSAMIDFVKGNEIVSDYSLFWVANILEDRLIDTNGVEKLVVALMEHPRASKISKSKVLEIPDQRYGLKEVREQILRNGGSDWLAWSSAVGCREEKKAARNHLLKYFAKGSRINALIAEIVQKH